MGSLLDKNESKGPSGEIGEAGGAGAAKAEQQPARRPQAPGEIVAALAERRKRLLEQDSRGRTPLFYAAEEGLEEEVRRMIFSFRGTGLGPTRLVLITKRDHSGLTAADVAEQNGHEEIASLLRGEQARMEYYE